MSRPVHLLGCEKLSSIAIMLGDRVESTRRLALCQPSREKYVVKEGKEPLSGLVPYSIRI